MRALGLALALHGAACSPRRWDVVLPDNLSDAGLADRPGGRGPGGHEGTGGQAGNADGGSGFDAGRDAFPGCGQLASSSFYGYGKPTVLLIADRSSNTRDSGSGDPWWRAENEAISGVLTGYGNALRIGYLAFPGNSMVCATDEKVYWQGDQGAALEDQIAACSMGTCVAKSAEVPLVGALNDAGNVFDPHFSGQASRNYAVVLIGSVPTCQACTGSSPPDLHSLASRAQTLFVPFGKSLDDNQCLLAFEVAANSKPPLSPEKSAHDKTELMNALQETFKEIASEYLCVFQVRSSAGTAFKTVGVQVGAGQPTVVPKDPTHQNGWDFNGSDTSSLRVFGPSCLAILSAASANPFFVSSATILDTTCGH